MPIVIYNNDTCKLIVVWKLYNTRTKTLMQYNSQISGFVLENWCKYLSICKCAKIKTSTFWETNHPKTCFCNKELNVFYEPHDKV